ncbi:hypothetical protein SCOR_05170 [Sulfidibacter corallicola]
MAACPTNRSELAKIEIDHREMWRLDLSASLFYHSTLRNLGRSEVSGWQPNLLHRRPSKHAGTPHMGHFDMFIRGAFRLLMGHPTIVQLAR